MIKEDIEKRIRGVFYCLFGVVFSFLIILTATFLNVTTKAEGKHKLQVMNLLVDGLQVRHKVLFEDFMSKSFASLDYRLEKFFNDQMINRYSTVIIDSQLCQKGSMENCERVKQLTLKSPGDKISYNLSLGNLYILIPVYGWEEATGYISVIIPETEFSQLQFLSNNIFLYIFPFIGLIILISVIYFLTERYIIKPTINKIIESEKLKVQQDINKQFAHDIRSPIIALELFLTLKLSPEEKNEIIAEALERIKTISNDLLGKIKNNKETEVDIVRVFENLVRDKKLEYFDRSLSLSYHVESVPRINIDEQQLYRVLSNLVNNSVEARQGDQLEIKLSASIKNEDLYITVSDNGYGIESELIPLIMKGGISTKANGHGLGLSGAIKWLHSLNGNLEIQSIKQTGTTINLAIPYK